MIFKFAPRPHATQSQRLVKTMSSMEPVAKNTLSVSWMNEAMAICERKFLTATRIGFRVVVLCVGVGVFGGHCSVADAENEDAGLNLFILSGQSNMAGMQPTESFTPAVEKAFGKDQVLVVKDAHGGQPIRRWYKDWKAADGTRPDKTGDLYDRLMQKVRDEMKSRNQSIKTVTFVWMQGERDAKERHGKIYGASLNGLFDQLSADLGRDDLNFVVGRLSDFDMENERYPHWTMVRKQQVMLAEKNQNCVWVDTDDLNDGKNRRGTTIKNDLHYSADGYVTLGQRFADQAVRLIKSRNDANARKATKP
jgi:hypothetical protein